MDKTCRKGKKIISNHQLLTMNELYENNNSHAAYNELIKLEKAINLGQLYLKM